ncbi:ferritin family protein [Thermococcus peptonophilus]|uniref:Rubrerythrin family protein n=1 Tax=Thermococcus peptonophilus TaxID=53952 RepID=A0A142CSM2_9EURY|nr:hypothetical protein [Thermococcus peptonophilus]AMQ17774.1 hypothetical protein A0127_00600 [Thermococcus peptonophilus]
MGERTYDHLKKAVEDLQRLSPQELLSYWIQNELKLAETCNSLSNYAKEVRWGDNASNLCEWLAELSVETAEKLMAEYQKRFGTSELSPTNVESIELILSLEDLKRTLKIGRIEDIIKTLLETQRVMHEIYSSLALKTSDERLSELFSALSELSRRRYSTLKKMLERTL